MKRCLLLALVCLSTLSVLPAVAESGVALGAKIGTVGLGGELSVYTLPRLNLRGGFYLVQGNVHGVINDVDYDFDIGLRHEALLLDWHCAANGFRLTGGAVFNQNVLDLEATPNKDVTIGDTRYPAGTLGRLYGTLEFDPVGPYLGVGYGNPFSGESHWSFSFDLGVIFQSYTVELEADGPLAGTPQFQADLQQEESDIQDFFDRYQIYPILMFGVAYRF